MDELYAGIRNANEEFIADKLEQVWETSRFCRCSRCKRDVYTYVLNKIEPHYVDSTQGELFMKLNFRDKGHNIEMIKMINAAMEVVGMNPKHEKPPEPVEPEAEPDLEPVPAPGPAETAPEELSPMEPVPAEPVLESVPTEPAAAEPDSVPT